LGDKQRESIAIDGKTLRGSRDLFHEQPAIHAVHAYSTAHGLCLAQRKCSAKRNEITIIPEVLAMLNLTDNVVTIDAMGTQTAIAGQIVDGGGDYILAVKGNQEGLQDEVLSQCSIGQAVSDTTTLDKGHGRIETRRCEVFKAGSIVDPRQRWKGLQSVIRITSTRELLLQGKTEVQQRYYISSLKPQGNDFNDLIRRHWQVENKLHWVLDMTFGEDGQRKRNQNAAANFALINKMALNVIKKDPDKKTSLKGKRLKAAWNMEYLIQLILMR
jgi:predicted transposase YbfD/YdcC